MEGLYQLYEAFSKFDNNKALKYIRLAEAIEVPLNPQKKRIYDGFEAYLAKKKIFGYNKYIGNIQKTLDNLNQEWERDYISDIILNNYQKFKVKDRVQYSKKLLIEYPYYFPYCNAKIDTYYQIEGDSKYSRRIKNTLKNMGFVERGDGILLIKIFQIDSELMGISLNIDGKTIKSISLNSNIINSKKIKNELYQELFTIKLD